MACQTRQPRLARLAERVAIAASMRWAYTLDALGVYAVLP